MCKELIERLLSRNEDGSLVEITEEEQRRAAETIEQQAKQIEELAAAQATIEQMREVLDYAASAFRELAQENDGDYETAEQMEAAAALPANLDALHEARAQECERLAGVCDGEEYPELHQEAKEFIWHFSAYLREEAAAHRAKKGK